MKSNLKAANTKKRPSASSRRVEKTLRPVALQVPRDTVDTIPSYLKSPTESILSLYMREVGEVALLTIDQENELAARIKRGDDDAREHMIRANLRLVVKIAREYEGFGLPLLDLINEGNIGLMKAVERFDPAKGGKLSTYSSWWIKQSIRRAIANQSRTIRLPIHAMDKLSRAQKVANEFREEMGREPTPEELADAMGVRSSRLNEIRTAALRPASLDAPVGEDDTTMLAERVADDSACDPYKVLEEKSLLGMLDHLVERLDDRERRILRMRFGLDGSKEQTLEEIGASFGLTRERIRQLQNGALVKLRQMIEEDQVTAVAA
ncbi:MAG: RNA polymerase sigma factor RpoD/SigA [Verrucomicrobiales bacterium]|nr:RNA polymerase sigma factor RpoD/SigA [Verrucomicrobiales bacterium]MCP5525468.1 RNA polymerase sigma factor RpoD/SigA [Verrucomicrobiales bacterium]